MLINSEASKPKKDKAYKRNQLLRDVNKDNFFQKNFQDLFPDKKKRQNFAWLFFTEGL